MSLCQQGNRFLENKLKTNLAKSLTFQVVIPTKFPEEVEFYGFMIYSCRIV